MNIVEIAAADPDFSTLVLALQTAELDDDLSGEGPFTVFAPKNAAFDTFIAGNDAFSSAQDLLNFADLDKVLTYHVLTGKVTADEAIALAGNTTATLNAANIAISQSTDGSLYINESKVDASVDATNGVIHVISKVLEIPTEVPANVDVECNDGSSLDSITDLANANSAILSTLVLALDAATLTATFDTDGDYTVFAPTDAAFDAFIAGSDDFADAAALLAFAGLEGVLKNHVYAGSVSALTAYTLNPSAGLATLGTGTLDINIDDTGLKINEATVVIKDIYACNGVIHVIDAVL
jgi:uncharacterized surface protein with fasciclin (FAS1) repeats